MKTLLELHLEIKNKMLSMADTYVQELKDYPADVKAEMHSSSDHTRHNNPNFTSRVAAEIIHFATAKE
jgi:hypothetical protein